MTEANSINAATTGIVGNTGTSFTGTAVTQFNVLVGGATSSTLANVPPSAASGIPLVSNGVAADPSFTTALIAGGGTGSTSFNINGPVISSTTTTGALSSITLLNQKFLVGNTSAAPTAKGLSVVSQVFTTPGANTYTPTAGMVYCVVEVIGGGGGGGGCAAAVNSANAGGGGGGGGYARKIVSSATIGASQTATVGAAGSAPTAGANPGGNGGTSSLGAIVSATGGTGGTGAASASATNAPGGAGGTGSSGDFNTTGMAGGCGFGFFTAGYTFALGGFGGSTLFGGGAPYTATGTAADGAAGTSFGGGGAGAATNNVNADHAGGAGGAGVVIITEYVIA